MKKMLILLILCIGLTLSAAAQGDTAPYHPDIDAAMPSVAATTNPFVEDSDDAVVSVDVPVDYQVGRGTVDRPDLYWADNGMPATVAFVNATDKAVSSDNRQIVYWTIGVVNADEAARQAILDLLSPSCHVVFRECSVSYAQRVAAYTEIVAEQGDIVRAVRMMHDSELVLVEIAEGYEKEYAQRYIERYGAFVGVTNDIQAEGNAVTGIGEHYLAELDGGGKQSQWWMFAVTAVLLLGGLMLLVSKRANRAPLLQTSHGTVEAAGSISRKQVKAAVQSSAVTPSDGVYQAIVERMKQ